MTKEEVFDKLRLFSNEQTKKVHMVHGARSDIFGVKVEDLKKIQKVIKKDYELSLELFDTGISDAMYLAALISEPDKMTLNDLNNWVSKAYWYMISEYSVPWVASESNFGFEIADQWIKSEVENIASSGWATLSCLVSIKNDDQIDLNSIRNYLNFIENNIHSVKNRVKYTMNGFILSVACYITTLTLEALELSTRIGNVYVDMGGTSCKVPSIPEYIQKVKLRGSYGKKRKTSFC